MKITQIFRSTGDKRQINEMNIEGANSATPVPIIGDNVKWILNDKVYSGIVRARLISYSAPESAVGRSDDFDIAAILDVDLDSQ